MKQWEKNEILEFSEKLFKKISTETKFQYKKDWSFFHYVYAKITWFENLVATTLHFAKYHPNSQETS